MRSWLITFSSRQQFLLALKAPDLCLNWTLNPITSFDFEGADVLQGKQPRDFSFSIVTYCAALVGIAGGFYMQYFSATQDTPLNIGGRPLNSWPAFIPITFICMILLAAISLFAFFFWRLRLPWLSHPVFFAKNYSLDKKQYQILFEGTKDIAEAQFNDPQPQIEELV